MSLVIFYIRLIVNQSHEKTKTNNKVILIKCIIYVLKACAIGLHC